MKGQRFVGKAALVTGASRGIGLAVAQRLVDEGARVCVTARNAEALETAVEQLGGSDKAFAVPGSADDGAHQQAAIEETIGRWGGIDLLVNNTGINPAYGTLVDLEDRAARKTMEVNVLGALGWTRRAWHSWMQSGGGAIVNVTSVAGLRPAHGIGFYGASKAALMHLTQQLAVELSPMVRVNAVAPAVVRTRFAGALFEGKESEVVADYPLGRLGEPGDIAAAVAYLGSADASWVTGQTLVLDGGLTLRGGV